MKKYLPFMILAISLILGLWLFNFLKARDNWRPEIDVLVLKINDIRAESAEMILQLKVKNKLPFGFHSEGFYFEILDGKKILAHTNHMEKVGIKGLQLNKIDFPLNIDRSAILDSAEDLTLQNNDSTNYTFRLQLYNPKSIFLPDSLQVERTFKFPTFKFPEVTFEGMETDHFLSKNKRKVVAKIRVKNYGNNPIEIVNPELSISLNNREEVLSHKGIRKLVIPAKSNEIYAIEVDVDTKALLANLGKLLFKKDESMMRIDFTANLITDNEMINNCKIRTSIKGDLASFMEKN